MLQSHNKMRMFIVTLKTGGTCLGKHHSGTLPVRFRVQNNLPIVQRVDDKYICISLDTCAIN